MVIFLVFRAGKVRTPFLLMNPSRVSPPSPVTVTRVRPRREGNRKSSREKVRTEPRSRVRAGLSSSGAPVQVVAGSPSKAERGRPAGWSTSREEADTPCAPVSAEIRRGSVRIAVPLSRTAPPREVKTRLKARPSSPSAPR